jgi:elongation factor Ts
MKVTAAMVKELRERTGAGMMDCRNALVAAECNMDDAIEQLRKAGMAKAAKKAGRVAAEGMVDAEILDDGSAVIVEVNCETDFVARNADFRAFVGDVKAIAATGGDIETNTEEARTSLVATIGENIQVRRAETLPSDGANFAYVHPGNRIGVILQIKADADVNANTAFQTFGKDLCFHIAAMNPLCTGPDDVPADVIEQEKRVAREQLHAERKPEAIIDKNLPGKLKRFFKDRCLLQQEAAMGEDGVTNQALLTALQSEIATPVNVIGFTRFELGEGIEKKVDDLASEVAALTAN